VSEGPEVRAAVVEDLEDLVDLHERLVEAHSYYVPYNRSMGRAALARAIVDPRRLVLVADPGGGAVAFINAAVNRNDWWGVEEGWIDDLYVLPEWRRRGLAKRLVAAALRWLEARDVLEVGVRTDPGFHAAIALYEGFGFAPRQVELYRRYRPPRGGHAWPHDDG